MTTIDSSYRAAPGAAGMIRQMIGAMADWNDARLTRKALNRLSARELDDIGLCFGDIDRIAQRRIDN